jgi:hypothetical protein
VQRRRDNAAAVKLMRKLLKKQGFAPEVLVTDKLRFYSAAKSEIGLSARHERGLRMNNRAENSHQPIRRRERKMQILRRRGEAKVGILGLSKTSGRRLMFRFSGTSQAAVDYNSTIIGALELSEKKWVPAVQLLGVSRHSRHVVDVLSDSLVSFIERTGRLDSRMT